MATCKECLHVRVCVINAFPEHYENTQWEKTPCDHFISTADVQEVIHAKWIISSNGYYPYCSHCKSPPYGGDMTKYCPECGARMDKE